MPRPKWRVTTEVYIEVTDFAKLTIGSHAEQKVLLFTKLVYLSVILGRNLAIIVPCVGITQ